MTTVNIEKYTCVIISFGFFFNLGFLYVLFGAVS